MPLTEKIPLQEKIAELEQRIEKLEKQRQPRVVRTTRTVWKAEDEGLFGAEWDAIWQSVDKFFERVRKAF